MTLQLDCSTWAPLLQDYDNIPRQLAFCARTLEEWTAWREALRSKLAKFLGGYLNTFRDSIMSVTHCECNYIPSILEVAEMYDVASLIAPRPLLVESGTEDGIFPVSMGKRPSTGWPSGWHSAK